MEIESLAGTVEYGSCYNRILNAITYDKNVQRTNRALNVFVAMPIRTGKSYISNKLVYDLVNKGYTRVGYCAPTLAELSRLDFSSLLDDFVVVHTFSQSEISSKIVGRNFEVIIIDEAENLSDANIIALNKLPCQKVYIFTPTSIDPKNPTELKKLWDTSLAFKFQLTLHDLGIQGEDALPYYESTAGAEVSRRTQIECEWVSITK